MRTFLWTRKHGKGTLVFQQDKNGIYLMDVPSYLKCPCLLQKIIVRTKKSCVEQQQPLTVMAFELWFLYATLLLFKVNICANLF